MAADLETALCQNLAFVRWLVTRSLNATAGEVRQRFVNELCETLQLRLEAIEAVVHPALVSNGWDAGSGTALSVHAALRERLGALLGGDTEDSGAGACLGSRLQGLDEQLACEASLLVGATRSLLDTPDRMGVARGLRARLRHTGSCVPRDNRAPLRRDCPARDGLITACPARVPA